MHRFNAVNVPNVQPPTGCKAFKLLFKAVQSGTACSSHGWVTFMEDAPSHQSADLPELPCLEWLPGADMRQVLTHRQIPKSSPSVSYCDLGFWWCSHARLSITHSRWGMEVTALVKDTAQERDQMLHKTGLWTDERPNTWRHTWRWTKHHIQYIIYLFNRNDASARPAFCFYVHIFWPHFHWIHKYNFGVFNFFFFFTFTAGLNVSSISLATVLFG